MENVYRDRSELLTRRLRNVKAVQRGAEIGPDARIVLKLPSSSDAASDVGASASPHFPTPNTSPASQVGHVRTDSSSFRSAPDIQGSTISSDAASDARASTSPPFPTQNASLASQNTTQNQLLSTAIALRGQLDHARASVCMQGQNAMVIAAKQGLRTFRDIENTAQELATRGHNNEAEQLMIDTKKTYDHGLQELSTVHGTIRKITVCMKEYANAIEARHTEKAKRHVVQLQVFSEKLSTTSCQVQQEFAQLVADLDQQLRHLREKYNLQLSGQTGCGVAAVVSGVGAVAAGGGAATTGLTTTTGLIFTATVCNPVGIGLAVTCGVAAVGAVVLTAASGGYGAAKASTAKMEDITKNVRGAAGLHTDMWKGVAWSSEAMRNSMDDLKELSLEDVAVLREAVLQSAENLLRLAHCVDEYIVFMAESKLYPICFDARTVVGEDKYESIRRMMITGAAPPR